MMDHVESHLRKEPAETVVGFWREEDSIESRALENLTLSGTYSPEPYSLQNLPVLSLLSPELYSLRHILSPQTLATCFRTRNI
jgi:hypothetical protein